MVKCIGQRLAGIKRVILWGTPPLVSARASSTPASSFHILGLTNVSQLAILLMLLSKIRITRNG